MRRASSADTSVGVDRFRRQGAGSLSTRPGLRPNMTPPLWPMRKRQEADRSRALRTLEDHDFLGRIALRWRHRALCLRRPHQRRKVPRLCRASSDADPVPRRHRHHGQSELPQDRRSSTSHRSSGSQPTVPARLRPRPRSNRIALRQTQKRAAQNGAPNRRRPLGRDRDRPQRLLARRMLQLPQECRI
jgi:hypothetical protein